MNKSDKNRLLQKLTESHTALREILKGCDVELQVYEGSDWQIRDIVGHITTWDLEVAKSLQAFAAGTEYAIPDLDEDDFNQQSVMVRRGLSAQEILREWEQAREDFKEAIRAIPEDQFSGELLYPWGDERGDIPQLVEYMIEHDAEHSIEIEAALDKLVDG